MSIASTIQSIAPSAATRYPRTFSKGVNVLESREVNGVSKILDFAVAKGADYDEVYDFLAGLGATMPDKPAPEHDDPMVLGLLEFARSKGYRG